MESPVSFGPGQHFTTKCNMCCVHILFLQGELVRKDLKKAMELCARAVLLLRKVHDNERVPNAIESNLGQLIANVDEIVQKIDRMRNQY